MKCPYCNSEVKFSQDSTFIYGRNYGAVYHCINYPSCDAYVGTHRNSKRSLGRLADAELRKYKGIAHMYFDELWKMKKARGFKNARDLGYEWLSEQMKKSKKDTHIGMFNIDECKKVIELCKPYYIKLKK